MQEFAETKDNRIREAIFRTVAFFDMFDYPLTANEIWKYLWQAPGVAMRELLEELDGEDWKNIVAMKNGFYFLTGREAIAEERMRRYSYADRKFKKAMRIAKIFRFIPWIRMIAVANLIGAHNLKDGSDIDFFIIVKKNKIWLVRFFTNLTTIMLGLRPRPGSLRDKICLSFYLSEENMDLERFLIDEQDVNFVYFAAGLTPIYVHDFNLEKFYKANSWIKKYLPNWQLAEILERRKVAAITPAVYDWIMDMIFSFLENSLKRLQLRKLPKEITEMMNKDTRVIVNDQVLKFHTKDKRKEYSERWRNKNYK